MLYNIPTLLVKIVLLMNINFSVAFQFTVYYSSLVYFKPVHLSPTVNLLLFVNTVTTISFLFLCLFEKKDATWSDVFYPKFSTTK